MRFRRQAYTRASRLDTVSSGSATGSVRIDTSYRRDLDSYAQQQYSAERVGDFERAERLRNRLRDDSPPVGMGAGRYVYPLPDSAFEDGAYERYVLKLAVPHEDVDGRDGCEQNRREAEIWRETESQYLVPVVAADERGYWLIMPRGKPITEETPAFERWTRKASRALSDDVWQTDIDVRNVVGLDGGLRLCDYGLPA